MDAIFLDSENRKASDPHKLINFSDKIDLEKVRNISLYQTLIFTIYGKIQKSPTKINLKYQL